MADRIQQRINDNISDLPIYYCKADKDTITLKYFISRVDQGVSTLQWTQARAFNYLKNHSKALNADW